MKSNKCSIDIGMDMVEPNIPLQKNGLRSIEESREPSFVGGRPDRPDRNITSILLLCFMICHQRRSTPMTTATELNKRNDSVQLSNPMQ